MSLYDHGMSMYLSIYLSVYVQDLCKRAAVLSNKIMKHGFVAEMEKILDAQEKVTHDELSKKVHTPMDELMSVDPDFDCSHSPFDAPRTP